MKDLADYRVTVWLEGLNDVMLMMLGTHDVFND